jgi:hypothetical protein
MSKERQRDQKTGASTPLLHQSVENLFEHELRTLLRMGKISGWPRILYSWRGAVIEARRQAENTGTLDVHLQFVAPAPRGGRNASPHLVELGSTIYLGKPPLVTYFIAIGEKTQDGRLLGLRKFHFDLDTAYDAQEPKPILHIQCPGRICRSLVNAGYALDAFDSLRPDLDKPRIASLPMSFALLAHSALLEYISADTRIATFIMSSEWLSSIVLSERFVLLPFLNHSLSWLQKTANEKSSLMNYFYRLPPIR